MTDEADGVAPDVVNVVLGDVSGTLVQAETINGNVYIGDGRPFAQSAYLSLVRTFLPRALIGRERELAELAAFCTVSVASRSYTWWRAPKWAGKTALMAWFVVHPPPGVCIVSFFITARHGNYDDRRAFVAVVLEQLAEILDEPVPQFGHPANEESYLRQAFDRAARKCAARAERLVLLVDGLDEDRGLFAGQRSIANLLPVGLVDGMRVIVTGRPHPPVPSDVGARHPLRDPDITRTLSISPAAQIIRDDMVQELQHLLGGTDIDRELAGLITVALGGLTASDLGELTGRPTGWVREHLRTVTGRTFDVRPSRWQPDEYLQTYLLGHEDLQHMVIERLGKDFLGMRRRQLCTWADNYREQRWPTRSPEYLLHGYHRMLVAADDTPRLIALATDHDRHDQLLHVTGNHAQTLHEIAVARDIVASQPEADLHVLARLAVVHNDVTGRIHIPINLPALWAMLGDFVRVDELIRSITDPLNRRFALYAVVKEMTEAGHVEEAQALAWTVTDPALRCFTLSTLARQAHATGNGQRANALADHAEALANTIGDPDRRIDALTDLISAVATADPGRAQQLHAEVNELLRNRDNAADRIRKNVRLVRAFATVHDIDHLRRLADEAESIAMTDQKQHSVMDMLCEVAGALHTAGDTNRAHTLLELAEQRGSLNASTDAYLAKSTLLTAWATTGRIDLACQIALTLSEDKRAFAWGAVGRAAATTGDLDLAREFAERNENLVRRHLTTTRLASALAGVGCLLVAAGKPDRARALAIEVEKLLRETTDPEQATRALVEVARLATAANRLDIARDFSDQAQTAAQQLTDSIVKSQLLDDLINIIARTAGWEQARILTEAIKQPHRLHNVLANLAEAAAEAGDVDYAWDFAEMIRTFRQRDLMARIVRDSAAVDLDRTEARVLRTPSLRSQENILLDLASTAASAEKFDQAFRIMNTIAVHRLRTTGIDFTRTLAIMGQWDRAEAFAKSLRDPAIQTEALVTLACAIGIESDRARRCLRYAEAISRLIYFASGQVNALCLLVPVAHILDGAEQASVLLDQADVLIGTLTEPNEIAAALVQCSRAATAVGDDQRAEHLLTRSSAQIERIADKRGKISALDNLAKTTAAAGRWDHATTATNAIEDARQQQTTWSALAHIAASEGDWNRADALVTKVADYLVKRELLGELATIAANCGDWKQAEAIGSSVSDQYGHSVVMNSLFATALDMNDLDRAETFASAISIESDRRTALRRLAGMSDGKRAKRIVAQILCTGHQMDWLDVLTKVCPEVPAVMLDEALVIHSRRAPRR